MLYHLGGGLHPYPILGHFTMILYYTIVYYYFQTFLFFIGKMSSLVSNQMPLGMLFTSVNNFAKLCTVATKLTKHDF